MSTQETAETETAAAIDAGQQIATLAAVPEQVVLADGRVAGYFVHSPAGFTPRFVPVDVDSRQPAPASTIRTVRVRSVGSFAAYLARHGSGRTEVYADEKAQVVTGIIDAPIPGSPAWEQHRVVLDLSRTSAWERWAEVSGRWLHQEAFADLVERSLRDIVAPDAATMLEIAQTFQASTRVEYQSAVRLDSGETQIVYQEELAASAGRSRQLEMPAAMQLAFKPWTACPSAYAVDARIRYRVKDKALALMVLLDDPQVLLESAFGDLVEDLAGVIGERPLFRGVAPS